jgi:large subunit ribosomal protein L1
MGKKSKSTPSQLAMSEVLEREYKRDEDSVESESAPKEIASKKMVAETKVSPQKPRKRGKKYTEAKKKVATVESLASITDAVQVIKSAVYTKIKESLELHVNVLEIGIKGEVQLPFSTGKKVTVVIADDAVLEKLEKGIIDFDILVTTPVLMPKLAKFAKLLGPRGLMPNPKAGTIGPNPQELVKKFSGNTVRFKTEPKAPIMHMTIGKTDFPMEELVANIEAYLEAIGKKNIKKAFLASSMTPSVQILI